MTSIDILREQTHRENRDAATAQRIATIVARNRQNGTLGQGIGKVTDDGVVVRVEHKLAAVNPAPTPARRVCARCGIVDISDKNLRARYCDGCRREVDSENKRAWYERQCAKNAAGGAPEIAESAPEPARRVCTRCGTVDISEKNLRARYCDGCRREVDSEHKRAWYERQRIKTAAGRQPGDSGGAPEIAESAPEPAAARADSCSAEMARQPGETEQMQCCDICGRQATGPDGLCLRCYAIGLGDMIESLTSARAELERQGDGDLVNHPPHYNSHLSGVECITITEHMSFCLGNAVKYIWRAGLKSGDAIEDLRKATWYIEREISRLAVAVADCTDN